MALNKSVDKALKILEFISDYPEGVKLSEIYKALDLPKATVFDILQALYKQDAVYYKNEKEKTYVIGSKVFAIGSAYVKNSNFISFTKEKLIEFCNKYDSVAFAIKCVDDKEVYIFKGESPNNKLLTENVGYQERIDSNESYYLYASYLHKDARDELITKYNLPPVSDEKIKFIKEDGFVIDTKEEYIVSVYVPVFNFEDRITGLLNARHIANSKNTLNIEIYDLLSIGEYVSMKQGFKGDYYEKLHQR